MSSYVIQSTDDPPFVTCKTCDGRGYTTALKWGIDPDWCPECGGAKEIALDMTALATLSHNLAIAAGLCESFNRGSDYRMRMMLALPASEDWKPGCGHVVKP